MNRTAEEYRLKAEESRTVAEGASNEQVRATILKVAEQYDRLAEQAEQDG